VQCFPDRGSVLEADIGLGEQRQPIFVTRSQYTP
jgi:hypothetical protein